MKLKDSELKSILAEVETEIASLLKSEGQALKKAKDEDAPIAEEGGAPVDAGPAEGSAPAEGAAPEASASPAPEASGPAPEASAAAPEASAAPAADPAADPAAAGPVDPEALKAEYAQLDPETLKSHYMAAKAALFEMMSAAGAGAAGPEASAPAPAGPPAPGPEASAPALGEPPPPAFKAELKDVPANGDALKDSKAGLDDIKSLGKSETDSKVEDLEKQVELMAKALDIALGTPIRKAVTSVAHLPRTDESAPVKEPTKAEVKEKIRTAMASGKLSKSQKDQLFSFTIGGLDFDQVKDLLEVK
jgi:hypothetical protein